jgi:hypothetical protein
LINDATNQFTSEGESMHGKHFGRKQINVFVVLFYDLSLRSQLAVHLNRLDTTPNHRSLHDLITLIAVGVNEKLIILNLGRVLVTHETIKANSVVFCVRTVSNVGVGPP